MKLSIGITISLLTLLPSFSAQASWWDCLCGLFRRDCPNGRVMPLGAHQNAYPNLLAARIGARMRVTVRGKSIEGVVVNASFDNIVLGVVLNGKAHRKELAHKKIESMELIAENDPTSRATPEELQSLGLSPLRQRVLSERLEARRKYIDFVNTDFFAGIRESVVSDVQRLRSMKSNEERITFLRAEGERIAQRVRDSRDTSDLGFHFNLNGGQGPQYVEGGGIWASRGDVAIQYGGSRDYAEKVYLFRSSKKNIFDILNTGNPKLLTGGRMGYELNVFNLEHGYFSRAAKEGGISNQTEISMDFNMDWLARQDFNSVGSGRVGVPYQTYLAPPISVFGGFRKQFPELGRLTRHEETLITMRQLEAILTSEKRFAP